MFREGNGFSTGAVSSFGKQYLARREVGVEAAMRQAGLLHDVRHSRAVVPAAPNGSRGNLDDALVCDFLTASGFPLD